MPDEIQNPCPLGCKYEADSFPCKIRHLSMNTGDCKAAND